MYTPIKNLKIGCSYEQVFMVGNALTSPTLRTSMGDRFAKLTLVDLSGTISGVVWNCTLDFTTGEYIRLKIDVQKDERTNQISFCAKSSSLEKLNSFPDNLYDYILGTNNGVLDSYSKEIENSIQIEDSDYRNLLGSAINKLDLIHALRNSPYGLTGPLSYRGGLLVHTVHSLKIALASLNQVQELEMSINRSLVVIGCILRNIGWHTTTILHDGIWRTRDAFKMTGIDRASVRYIDHLCLAVEADLQIQINESKKQAFENICSDSVLTIEGRIINLANKLTDVLHFGNFMLKEQKGNWAQNNVFVGHNK